ncbi:MULTISPECIES: hypothetical protein [Marinobacter]|uniref:hypothetical protein n=1 Tax=Marinobacter TaxID=2742 RepID=UPI0012454FBA|nr:MULTISPECIES: hypothetical protein [Marinobacter]MBL3557596.1 hypothetical protein [Marinobacter sp. JB05H06]
MSDIKKESIKVLYRSMIDALQYPDAYPWITSKCGSQAAIASVERRSIGIHAMTLNTFKKYSDAALDGGFEQLEKLRVAIKRKSKNANGETSKGTKSKTAVYKEKLDEAERLRAILIRAYTDLNRICLDAVRKSPEYQYDLDRHNELYREYFSLTLVANDD